MPDIVSTPQISVNSPNGNTTITNPLYNYTFNPQPSASDFPPTDSLAKYHSTVRYPDANGQSQPNLVNAQLSSNGNTLRTLTYQLITSGEAYDPMSNTAYSDGKGGSYNNIENIHNAIHVLVGYGGHMSIVPYSGFDPIFFLHHV